LKKILIFIDWFTPAVKAGGPISSVENMVNFLAEEFDFYIITGAKDLNSEHNLQGVVLNKWQKVGSANVIYLEKSHIKNKILQSLVAEINPSKIYLNGIFSFKFSILPCLLFITKYNTIIAPRGMLGTGALAVKSFRKIVFLQLMKSLSIYKNIHWHLSNDKELEDLNRVVSKSITYSILPNITKKIEFQERKKSPKVLNLISICRINKIKNIEFFLRVLSDIKFECKYTIIGFVEDSNYYNSLLKISESLPSNITVEFIGQQKFSKITDYLKSAHIFISTSNNENFGHSIVESLATGLPVLISENCPWNNLEKYNAGFRLPLTQSYFKEKLIYLNEMSPKSYKGFNNGSRDYYDKFVNPSVYKNGYIKLFS
jgi:glycosyltransferase involved in cell wall biosynthesis